MHTATLSPAGELGLTVIRRAEPVVGIDVPWPSAVSRRDIVEHGMPHVGLPADINIWRARNQRHLQRGWRRIALAKALGVPTYYGALFATILRGDGRAIPLGLASLRVVTDTGVGYIVDAFQNSVELENMKFHGYGTGSTAESAAQTGLVTELTTEYAGNVRPTGTTTEGASANIYRSVATLTPDSGGTIALREHGIFSANSAGVMLDRTLFSAINLDSAAGDSLQTTYDLTFPSGS